MLAPRKGIPDEVELLAEQRMEGGSCGIAADHAHRLQSKTFANAIADNLVECVKADVVTGIRPWPTIDAATDAARTWCAEVNGRIHTEIDAVPDKWLPLPTRRLSTCILGSLYPPG